MFHDEISDLEEEEFLKAALSLEKDGTVPQLTGKRRSFELGIPDAESQNVPAPPVVHSASHSQSVSLSSAGNDMSSPVIPMTKKVEKTVVSEIITFNKAHASSNVHKNIDVKSSSVNSLTNSTTTHLKLNNSRQNILPAAFNDAISDEALLKSLTNYNGIESDRKIVLNEKLQNHASTQNNQVFSLANKLDCDSKPFQATLNSKPSSSNLFQVSKDSFDSDLDLSLECLDPWDKEVDLVCKNDKATAATSLQHQNRIETSENLDISLECLKPWDKGNDYVHQNKKANVDNDFQNEIRIGTSDKWTPSPPYRQNTCNIDTMLSTPTSKIEKFPNVDLSPIATQKKLPSKSPTPLRNKDDFELFIKPTVPLTSQLRTPVLHETNRSAAVDNFNSGDKNTYSNKGLSHTNRLKRKRKFPGPAGVLPRLGPGASLDSLAHMNTPTPVSPQTKKIDSSLEVPSSQSWDDLFTDWPWQQMKQELEPQAEQLLADFSVVEVLMKAKKKMLPRGKVPVICVLIDKLELHSADASVVLKDPTGEMKGTIHRQLLKEYEDQLQTGAALVLRQVGVFSPSNRNHYLNITPNNLLRIYSKNQDGLTYTERLTEFSREDFVIPPVSPAVQPVSPALSPSGHQQRHPYPQHPQKLFPKSVPGSVQQRSPLCRPTTRMPIAQLRNPQNSSTQRHKTMTTSVLSPVQTCISNTLSFANNKTLNTTQQRTALKSTDPHMLPSNSMKQKHQENMISSAIQLSTSSEHSRNSKFDSSHSSTFPANAPANQNNLNNQIIPSRDICSSTWGDDEELDEVLNGLDEELLKDF